MIPQRLEDLDPPWLTDRLQNVAPGVTVESVEVVHAADATNFNATLRVHHDAPSLPTTMFLKIPPVEPGRRARLDWASMGEREARFYRELAPRVGFRVPETYIVELDADSGEFFLLMEHVDRDGCAVPDPSVGVAPDMVERALTEFAALHAHYERSADRATDVPWLRPTGRTSDYGARLLREGIESGADLAPAFVAVAEAYIDGRDRLQDAWELGPTTVLHGDAHVGNVFVDCTVDPGRLGLFDWGLMTVGSPMRDVSYFITMTLDPATRADHERELLDAYLAARGSLGATEIPADVAWRWHRVQSAYTVVASCQSIVMPAAASGRRRAFSAAFLGRATAAVEDLDPLGAMDSLG